MKHCNCCLRKINPADDPGNGMCGPCNRLETPESNPDLLEED